MASPVDDEVWRAAYAGANAPTLSAVKASRPVVFEGELLKRGDFQIMGQSLSFLPKKSIEAYLPWAQRHCVPRPARESRLAFRIDGMVAPTPRGRRVDAAGWSRSELRRNFGGRP